MATKIKTEEGLNGEIGVVVNIIGGQTLFNRPILDRLDAHRAIEHGFPASVLSKLVANVAIIQRDDVFQKALGISRRTMFRTKLPDAKKLLSKEQSGRAWKFAEIVAKATRVFGSQDKAEDWMEEPAIGLNGNAPIDLLSTTAGTELVENFLDQIEYGVYV